MKYDKAIRIARVCLEAEIKRLATQANLADIYHADTPACISASERRRELREALGALGQKVML